MGHKSELSSSSTPSSHHRRTYKGHREPSVHSISSSEISSEASSAIHKRSTPKIAAVIIAAILVISGLIGITVYLVSADRFGSSSPTSGSGASDEAKLDSNQHHYQTGLDYQTYHDESARLLNHQRPDEVQNHRYIHPMDPYRQGKDPEGPTSPEVVDKKSDGVIVDGQGDNLNQRLIEANAREEVSETAPGLFGNQDFTQVEDVYESGEGQEAVDHQTMDYYLNPYQEAVEDRPYGTRLTQGQGRRRTDLYNMEPYISKNRVPYRQMYQRNNNNNNHNHQKQLQVQADMTVASEDVDVVEASDEDMSEAPPLPPNGSRGGIHVPVDQSSSEGGGLATLDRRPGRPAFHHLGPTPTRKRLSPAMRRRIMRMRQQQQLKQQMMFNRRLGLQAADQAPVNPIQEAKEMLANFDSFVALAESEASMLKSMAANITEQGKPLNLEEILKAVNETVKANPDSAIAKLLNRFYQTYLLEEEMEANEASPVAGGHQKSLSSLLFLAFGIFLLNSVNNIMAKHSVARNFGASAPELNKEDLALKSLWDGEEKFNDEAIEEPVNEEDNSLVRAAGQSRNVNNFLRLLMNLMKAYSSGDDSDLDCIWYHYCQQLNRQAAYGGVISTVARINSVGMRVILKDISSRSALGALTKSMVNWQDLECRDLFSKCNNQPSNDSGS